MNTEGLVTTCAPTPPGEHPITSFASDMALRQPFIFGWCAALSDDSKGQAHMPRPESITMAQWWGNKLRDTSWLKAENVYYKSLCHQQRLQAGLTEQHIHAFEVHLADVIDKILEGQESPYLLAAVGRQPDRYFDPLVSEVARKAGFYADNFMFPSGAYTRVWRDEIFAGSEHENWHTLPLIRAWS